VKITGIVIPTRWEARPVLSSLAFRKLGSGLYQHETAGQKFLIKISGMGKEPARAAAHALCDLGSKELVSAGFCGAVSPGLRVGDLIRDRIGTSATMIWTQEDRLRFAARAGAQAVDMETQAVIEAGTRRGVPIRIIRVISDQLEDDLSPLFGADSAFSMLVLVSRLWNPKNWLLLIKLWRQSQVASAALVDYLGRFMAGQLGD
jgi:nucleoside phosphorylase